ncbi:MAG TPA: hypothetical protein VN181_07370, partial [Thermoanaerobaculia bacterium]|nr:hypothetical protein [Thermoanaerobaculia bacterium]
MPDGREPGDGIDPHYASIVVSRDSVAAASGWSSSEITSPGTYSLLPCEIVIEGANFEGALDTSEHDGRLPELRKIDPNFAIDVARAQTIASLRIRQGKLTAYHVPDGSAIITELTVPHDGPIRITVIGDDGSQKTIDLRPGTEIA